MGIFHTFAGRINDIFFLLWLVEDADEMENSSEDNKLEFSKFDIRRVLQHGEPLVGSSGEEYDVLDEEIMSE